MKITAHFDSIPFNISPSPDGSITSTWAQRTQRFVEESLLDTQKLLKLLTLLSSSSSSSSSSPPSGVGRYKLRFGGGHATMILVTWSDGSSHRSEVIEANITLKSRDKLLFDEFHPSERMPTSLGGSSSEPLHVDVIVEVIDFAPQQRNEGGKNGKGGGGLRFPMTKLPFPVDDKKMNFMCVWEHPQCKGVVNRYTNDLWSEGCNALWLAAHTTQSVVQDSVLNTHSHSSRTGKAADKTSNDQGMDVESDMNGVPSSTPKAGSASKSTSAGKGDEITSSKSKQLLSGDSDQLEGIKSTAKKSTKSTSKTSSNAPESMESGAVSSTATKQKTKKRKKESTDQETEDISPPKAKGKKTPSIKRPPNAFMLFLDDIRAELKTKYPGVTAIELSTRAGVLYRELTAAERLKYSNIAMMKLLQFHEEHPELGKRNSKASAVPSKVPPPPPPPRVVDDTHENGDSGEGGDEKKAASSGGAENEKKSKKAKKNEKAEKKSPVALSKPASPPRAIDDTQIISKGRNEEKTENGVGSEKVGKEKKSKKAKKKKSSLAPPVDDAHDKDDSEEESDEKKADGGDIMDEDGDEHADKPKRPLNAFWMYADEIREKVKAANPDLNSAGVLRKVSESYKALDFNARKRYRDLAAKARAEHVEKHGEDAMKLGPRSKDTAGKKKQKEEAVAGAKSGRNSDDSTGEKPSDSTLDVIPSTPAKGMPHGWITRAIPRKNQSNRTKADTVWYSPVESYTFKSAAEAKKFHEMTEKTNGDETKAYRLLHPNGKQLKGTDAANAAVNDSKKSKKSKKVVAQKGNKDKDSSDSSKEDDRKVAAKMSDDEDEDPRESKEDSKRSAAEMSDNEDEDSSKSEQDNDEMSEEEDSSVNEEEEEEGMPESWND